MPNCAVSSNSNVISILCFPIGIARHGLHVKKSWDEWVEWKENDGGCPKEKEEELALSEMG